MPAKDLKILLVGPGAVGGTTAGFISKAGYDLSILARNPKSIDHLRSSGLHVFGRRGEVRATPPVYASPSEVPEKMDIILLATKATSLPDVVHAIRPFMKPSSVLVSLQNGFCAETIADIIGVDAVIACVVSWGATMHAPGEYEMTSTGNFVIGRLDGRMDATLTAVQELLQAVLPTGISANIKGHLYAKLIINSCITTLGAISGMYLGKLLAMRNARNIFIEIIREAMNIAHAMGLKVESVAKLDFDSFLKGTGPAAYLERHTMIRLIGLKYRRLKSSSLQSLERGERTEVDYLNGTISAKGKALGIPTPLNDFLTELVHSIEAGTLSISPKNIDSAEKR